MPSLASINELPIISEIMILHRNISHSEVTTIRNGRRSMTDFFHVYDVWLQTLNTASSYPSQSKGVLSDPMNLFIISVFQPLRAYWGALLERVAAMDELDMAKMRLRAKLPDEPYDPVSQPYIIIPAEVRSLYLFFHINSNYIKKKILNSGKVDQSGLVQIMLKSL